MNFGENIMDEKECYIKGHSDSVKFASKLFTQDLFNSMTTLIKGTTAFKHDILHPINLLTLNVALNTLDGLCNVRSAPSLISTYCTWHWRE